MVTEGDFVRHKALGTLHRVYFIYKDMLSTIRLSDHAHVRIKREDAVRVLALSMFPGDPEVTQRAA